MILSMADWLWREQGGICWLRITEDCAARDHIMSPRVLTDKAPPDSATLEHVWPKSKKALRPKGEATLLVLACSCCNSKKGADLPSVEYLVRARMMHARWQEYRATYGMQTDASATLAPMIETRPAASVAEAMLHQDRRPPVEKHPRLPAAGYDKPLSARFAEARVTLRKAMRAATFDPEEQARLDDEARAEIARAAYGVTDPNYLPGGKAKAREERDAAAKAQRDEWRAKGLMMMGPTRKP